MNSEAILASKDVYDKQNNDFLTPEVGTACTSMSTNIIEKDNYDSDATFCSQLEQRIISVKRCVSTKRPNNFTSSQNGGAVRKQFRYDNLRTEKNSYTAYDNKQVLAFIRNKIKEHVYLAQYMDRTEIMNLLKQVRRVIPHDEHERQAVAKIILQLKDFLTRLDEIDASISASGSNTENDLNATCGTKFLMPSYKSSVKRIVNKFPKIRRTGTNFPVIASTDIVKSFSNVDKSLLTNCNFESQTSNIFTPTIDSKGSSISREISCNDTVNTLSSDFLTPNNVDKSKSLHNVNYNKELKKNMNGFINTRDRPPIKNTNKSFSFSVVPETLHTNGNFESQNSNILIPTADSSVIPSTNLETSVQIVPKQQSTEQTCHALKKSITDDSTNNTVNSNKQFKYKTVTFKNSVASDDQIVISETQQSADNFLRNTIGTPANIFKNCTFGLKSKNRRRNKIKKPVQKKPSEFYKYRKHSNNFHLPPTTLNDTAIDKTIVADNNRLLNPSSNNEISKELQCFIPKSQSTNEQTFKISDGKTFFPINEAELKEPFKKLEESIEDFKSKFRSIIKSKSEAILQTKPQENASSLCGMRYKNLFDSNENLSEELPMLFEKFTLSETDRLYNEKRLEAIASRYDDKYNTNLFNYSNNDEIFEPLPNWEEYLPKYNK